MIYINAILVLVIVYLVAKLTLEYREMRQAAIAKASMKRSPTKLIARRA